LEKLALFSRAIKLGQRAPTEMSQEAKKKLEEQKAARPKLTLNLLKVK
jgi:hypothetical protein